MRRRKFISLVGCAAAVWSLPARAQQPAGQIRRLGVLMPYAEYDPAAVARVTALRSALHGLGWTDGINLRVDYRYAPKVDAMKTFAAELVNLNPDLLVTSTNLATITLWHQTRTIPIVFVGGGDMIREGLVASLAEPGGNVTGFTNFEPAMGSKWLELLTTAASNLHRIGFLHNPDTLANINDMKAARSAAELLKQEVVPLEVRDASQIEHVITDFTAGSGNGLVVAPNPVTIGNHKLIVQLAASRGLPSIYPFDFYTTEGGLMSYGPDQVDMFKRAASYVDRVLKGETPAILPVQTPTKFELVINMKTAKTLGIGVPISMQMEADEVIE